MNAVFPDGKYGEATAAAYSEVNRALHDLEFPEFNSTHEGFAVLKEEVDEMWDKIKTNNKEAAVYEAIQVAAMAIRFAAEFGVYPYKKPPMESNFSKIRSLLVNAIAGAEELWKEEAKS